MRRRTEDFHVHDRSIVHAILGYLFLVITIRLLSRRPGAQMTPFEFVLVFLIGGVIILSTVGDDHSMTNCFGAVITICMMHHILTMLKARFPSRGCNCRRSPLLLLKDGQWQTDIMHRMRLDDNDVMAAARTQSVKTLDQVSMPS